MVISRSLEVQIGDYVWSKDDDNTCEWGWKPVTDAYSHIHQDGLILSIQKADGTELTITTTAEHPFYSNGVWYRADQLQVGMELTTPEGTLELLATQWLEQELPAYNLTVGQTHTYTVGEQMVWVHNDCDKNKHGGGKNDKHSNPDAREAAKLKWQEAKNKLEQAKRDGRPKKEKVKIEKEIKHWKKKMDFSGENHSMKPKK